MDRDSNDMKEQQVKLLAALVERRLDGGGDFKELLESLRPPPPVEAARARAPGLPDASWIRPDVPLLGLSYLDWKDAPPELRKRFEQELLEDGDEDSGSSPENDETAGSASEGEGAYASPVAIRVAYPEVFNGWPLIHAMYGAGEIVDYDLFGTLPPRETGKPASREKHLLKWQGGSVAAVVDDAEGDISRHPEDYVRIFCATTAGDEGRFPIIDPGDLDERRRLSFPLELPERFAARIREETEPIAFAGISPKGEFRFSAAVYYARHLFRAQFALTHQGRLEMTDDEPVADADKK